MISTGILQLSSTELSLSKNLASLGCARGMLTGNWKAWIFPCAENHPMNKGMHLDQVRAKEQQDYLNELLKKTTTMEKKFNWT